MDDEKIRRVVADLTVDYQRQGEMLSVAQTERAIDRRKLAPDEANEVWRALQESGIVLAEDPDRGFLTRFSPRARANTKNEAELLGMYLQEVGQIRLLNADDEVELGRRIQLGNDADQLLHSQEGEGDEEFTATTEARDSLLRTIERGRQAWSLLVTSNLRLVVSVAKTYSYESKHLEFLDVIQDGNFGLFRAAEKFDYKLGFKFSTYATWWIRQSIQRGLANRGRIIRLPVHVSDDLRQLSSVEARLQGELGRMPTLEEVSQRLDFAIDKIQFLRDVVRDPISLDAPLVSEDSDGYAITEYLDAEGMTTSNPEDVAIRHLVDEHVRSELLKLTPRERVVLERRFGLDGMESETLEQVGERLDLTRERVRQIQSGAISKLRLSGNLRGLLDSKFSDINEQ